MKKRMMMVLAAMLALLLTAGCGSTKEEIKSVDLTEFYNGLRKSMSGARTIWQVSKGTCWRAITPAWGHLHQAVHRHDAPDVLCGQ